MKNQLEKKMYGDRQTILHSNCITCKILSFVAFLLLKYYLRQAVECGLSVSLSLSVTVIVYMTTYLNLIFKENLNKQNCPKHQL